MRKEQFIEALHGANWRDYGDSQWTEIEKLWRQLFPVVAELEDELKDALAGAEERERKARREALEEAADAVMFTGDWKEARATINNIMDSDTRRDLKGSDGGPLPVDIEADK